MLRRAVWLSGLSLLVLGACQDHKAPVAKLTPLNGAMRVQLSRIDDLKPLSGIYTNRYVTPVSARISGVLTALSVKEGDFVSRGQTLGFVYDQKITYQTSAFDSTVAAAQAQMEVAEANLKRTQALYDKGIYALARLEADQAVARAARAQYQAAKSQKSASAEAGNQGAIIAPADGRVLQVHAPLGSVVMAGQPVISVTSGAPVVRLDVPQAAATNMMAGMPITLQIQGQTVMGKITQVYPAVNNGQLQADVTPDQAGSYAVGEQVTAFVVLGQRDAIIIPKSYVKTRYGLDYVVRAGAGGGVMEIPIKGVPYGADGYEVLSGLTAGDQIGLPQ